MKSRNSLQTHPDGFNTILENYLRHCPVFRSRRILIEIRLFSSCSVYGMGTDYLMLKQASFIFGILNCLHFDRNFFRCSLCLNERSLEELCLLIKKFGGKRLMTEDVLY